MKGMRHPRHIKDRPRNTETGFPIQEFENSQPQLPYRTRDDFLTHAEISFFHVLSSVVGPDHYVFPKVRLSDVLFVAQPDKNLALFNQINQKHLDFLVCSRKGMRPILGVELDDSSHRREDRRTRDEFVDHAFAAAGLRLARVTAQHQYDPRLLVAELGITDLVPAAQNGGPEKSSAGKPEGPSEGGSALPPSCPKCGLSMVQRVATNGAHKGEPFWGCVNFPRCRKILPINWMATQTMESTTGLREGDSKTTKPLQPTRFGLS
jgi:hypothetical protein